MTVRELLTNFFRIDKEDEEIIQNEIRTENIRRVFYLSLIAIPVSILHVVLFGLNLKTSEGIEYTWRVYIIYSHLIIIFSLLVLCFLIYWFSPVKKKYHNVSDYSVYVLMAFLLIGGATITAFDQLVTTAITPFITICIVSAIVLLIKPIYSLIFYTGSYLIFYFSISLTQTNADVLISNRVNGISIATLGMLLSFIFWQGFLIRKKQLHIINKQQQELQESYNKLIYYSDELKESNSTKDKLFSIIAHDLRGPLSSVLGITDVLTEDIELMSLPEIKHALKALNKETALSYEFLSNLLDWSTMQLHKFEPKKTEVNMNQLTTNTIELLKNISNHKNITVINGVKYDIIANADLSMMRSVIKNLLVNSIKFTRKEGKVSITATRENKMIVLLIKDTGIGMTHSQVQDLFKPDNKQTTPGTENEKGTGLGLQICKEFIELNGGKIWVESEFGKGSSFYFSVPAK